MITLKRKMRSIFIISIALLAIAMAACAVVVYVFPGYVTGTRTQLRAESTAEIVYSVLMNDNPIYEDKIVSDEKYYLKPFTKYLDIDCSLTINADKDALIECTNQVYGLLISEITTEDGSDRVWEKRYDYAIEQAKDIEGTVLTLSRGVLVSLEEYEALTNSLIEEYSIFTDYYLRIVFENQIMISKDGKSETEQLITYIDVPFTNNVMEITNDSPMNSEILIKEEISQRNDPNEDLGFLFIVLFSACIICLLVIIFRTKGVDKQDKFTSEVEKIFKEYGNRLAGLTDTLAYQSSVMISIDKIEDMVKIADEIGQTIFYYQVDETEERKIEFYVFDEGRIYYLVMFGKLKEDK